METARVSYGSQKLIKFGSGLPIWNSYLGNLFFAGASLVSYSVYMCGCNEYDRNAMSCIAIFHIYCCYTKHVGIMTNLALRNHWGYITDISKYHNPGIRIMD